MKHRVYKSGSRECEINFLCKEKKLLLFLENCDIIFRHLDAVRKLMGFNGDIEADSPLLYA